MSGKTFPFFSQTFFFGTHFRPLPPPELVSHPLFPIPNGTSLPPLSLSSYVISKFAERYEARSYGQLVRRALGRKLALSLRLVLSSYLCGSCVAYMVIVGDCFTPLLSSLAERLGGGGGGAWSGVGAGGGGGPPPPPPPPSLFAVAVSFPSPAPPSPSPPPRDLVDRAHVIWAAAALVAYPLCLPRTLGALAKVSAAAVAGFADTAAAVVARGLGAVSTRGRHHR